MKKRASWIVALLALVLTSLALVAYLDPVAQTRQIPATLSGLHQVQSKRLRPPKLLATLDDGRVVQVGFTEGFPFIRGRRVLLEERSTKLLKFRSYRLLSYLPAAEPVPPVGEMHNASSESS